ncbi:MAG: ELM1/GtrOC1 family putative glycosyltransferase [Moraxellaceae bacterium]|nr:ELM1/GtrOC1 family putative glycosyltransferase [Moraxellaceae bacterium]
MSDALVIWRLTDGKPGHMQQSLGLVQALQRLTPIEVLDIDVAAHPVGFLDLLLRRFPGGFMQRRPKFIIGAGHATHLGLLAAKRITGASVVVLMKPSLPAFLFDHIVVPEHDGVAASDRIMVTRGVLNPMRPGEKVPASLLVLVGGESKHASWDDVAILKQVDVLVSAQKPGAAWRIADSRRTPESLSAELLRRYGERFQRWQDCPPGWLAQKLAVTETVWVSEDSVSMVYEALTAGCRVGMLALPGVVAGSRVVQGVQQLVNSGVVTRFNDWYSGQHVLVVPPVLNEADRVAKSLLDGV